MQRLHITPMVLCTAGLIATAHAGGLDCLQSAAYAPNAGISARKLADGALSADARTCLDVLVSRAQIAGRLQVYARLNSSPGAESSADLEASRLRSLLLASGNFGAGDIEVVSGGGWLRVNTDAGGLQFLVDQPEVVAVKDEMAFRATL